MVPSKRMPWNYIKQGFAWRMKRIRQYLRVRYLSWGHGEVDVAGVRIPLFDYISDNVRDAMFAGGYETAELKTIEANLEPSDVVLEVGTGIGLISTFCAKKIGSERVFTFEANHELEKYIRQVYQMNGVSPSLSIGILGDSNGESSFNIHADFWSSSTCERSGAEKRVKVARHDINKVFERVRPTFLIIDIEGGEAELFEIMNLQGITKLAIELHNSIIGDSRVNQICKQLEEQGFVIDWRYSSSIEGFKKELFLRRSMTG